MPKKKDNQELSAPEIKELQNQNELFKSIISNISGQNDDSKKRQDELNNIARTVDHIIRSEIDSITKVTGDDITTFLYKTLSQDDRIGSQLAKSINDIFANAHNESIVASMFQKQNNRNVLLEELEVIVSYIPELKKVIKILRDSIITSDDFGVQISRTISFNNQPQESPKVKDALLSIDRMEKDLKLQYSTKNHIVPKTLAMGTQYAYTVPYSVLIKDYESHKSEHQSIYEATSHYEAHDFESYRAYVNESTTKMKNTMDEYLKDIEVNNDPNTIIDDIMTEEEIAALESSFSTSSKDFAESNKKIIKNVMDNKIRSGESVIDTNDKKNPYSNVTGCYFKLIPAKKLIEVKVLNKVIGYYYIIDTGIKSSVKRGFNQSFKMNLATMQENKEDVEAKFIHMIADKIVKAMNKKYLEDNHKFKDLIVNAIMYDDMYQRKLKFQFITVDYITKFSIDEDEDGEGQSVLINSLFYAKLYLYLLIFRMLSILMKSQDQRYHYIKSSGIDKDTANKTQSAARAMKENEMTFKDLMNYGTALNKISKSKDVWIPTGTQGDRPIETDILQGQDIDFDNDFSNKLLDSAINCTPVPSVMLSYINEADYSRTLVMANAELVASAISYQLDFNTGLTEMYKKLARYYLNLDEELVDSLTYTLALPSSLRNVNMAEIVSNIEQTTNFIIRCYFGDQRNASEEDNIKKDAMFFKVAKDLLPMIQWNHMDELYKETLVEAKKYIMDKKAYPDDENL